MSKAEEIIRNSDDPRFIVWKDLYRSDGLTESLVREYQDFIWDRIDWLEIAFHLGPSEDFCREFFDKYDCTVFGD